MRPEKKEALYLVDNEAYLHLKETSDQSGFSYETFDKATGQAGYKGLITYGDMLDSPVRSPLACARVLAIEKIGYDGHVVTEVALRTLEQLKDARRAYRLEHEDDPKDRSIRFITSKYDELFRIPDGGKVKIDYPDRSFVAPCEYIDDYHTRIGGEIFHICQFAEMLERVNGKVSPEPEILKEQAAWQLAHREYLSIHATENGWDYSVYDKSFSEVDGGQIDRKGVTIQECRDMILQSHGWQNRNFTELDYDMVENRAAEAAGERLNSVLEQLHEKRMVADKGSAIETPHPSNAGKTRLEDCL